MNTDQSLERREFFKKIGFTLAATTLACNVAEMIHADEPTSKRVLVAYASRAGSTAEVAEAIGQVLRGKGLAVEVLPAGKVTDVSAYRAAIVGSAVRMGKWLPEGSKLVDRNRAELAAMPTGFFTVCLTMQKDTPENRRVVEGYMQPILQKIHPSSVGLFGGKMDYSSLGFVDRFIVSKMKKVPEGDYRDWRTIRAWAGGFGMS
ncbi:MAG TPA: flavodoxin domain-containing protein [Acidobacteriota bacterium]|nr:flavodoxin domain-containing protein [Acidobacteriota bacterium]